MLYPNKKYGLTNYPVSMTGGKFPANVGSAHSQRQCQFRKGIIQTAGKALLLIPGYEKDLRYYLYQVRIEVDPSTERFKRLRF